MSELKKLGVLSVAKISAVSTAIFGLIAGIFIALLGTAIGALAGSAGVGAGMGVFAIIALPIIYGVLGFISGAVGAFLYNIIAGWIGGVEMNFGK